MRRTALGRAAGPLKRPSRPADMHRMGGWAWRGYVGIGLVLGAAYFLAPGVRGVAWAALGFGAAVATLLGVRGNRPTPRLPWLLLAAGQACFATGDVLQWVRLRLAGVELPNPNLANVCYLVTYVLLTAALLLLVRARTTGRDLPSLLDAMAITTGLGLLAWVFLMAPYLHDPALSLADKLTSILLPLADVALLAVLARLWSGPGHHRPAYYLLGLAITATLLSDVAASVVVLRGSFTPGGPIDLGYLVFWLASGAAALHPSMPTIAAPAPPAALTPSRRRLVLLASVSLLAPAVLLVQWLRGASIDAPVLAAGSALLFLLTLTRMTGLATQLGRQAERQQVFERVLRATEDERTRIANDLHDGPVQQLTALGYGVHRIQRKLAGHELTAADQLLDRLGRNLAEEVQGLRRLMTELRPPALDEQGLEAALRDHVQAFTRDTKIACQFDATVGQRLTPEAETALYRVTQESLTNIVKHAAATRVAVALTERDHAVRLRISDNGAGFDSSRAHELLRQGHFGLAGMRERVTAVGGRWQLDSAPGQGTTITVTVPTNGPSPQPGEHPTFGRSPHQPDLAPNL
jgi:signal transduction histidine kinase